MQSSRPSLAPLDNTVLDGREKARVLVLGHLLDFTFQSRVGPSPCPGE